MVGGGYTLRFFFLFYYYYRRPCVCLSAPAAVVNFYADDAGAVHPR